MPEVPAPSASMAVLPGRVLLLRFEGCMRVGHVDSIVSHPAVARAFLPGMLVINDLRNLVLDADFGDMRNIMERIDALFRMAGGAPSGGAMIAPSDLAFGLSRMYKLLTGDSYPTLEVFREWDDAIRWLELDPTGMRELASRLAPIELEQGEARRA